MLSLMTCLMDLVRHVDGLTVSGSEDDLLKYNALMARAKEICKHEPASSTARVVGEVFYERVRQDRKWGEQNHPSFDASAVAHGFVRARYCVPSAGHAKAVCESMFSMKQGTYADILMEEVAEAFEEHHPKDKDKLQTELIQVAAVAVAWVEAIRRGEQKYAE